MTLNNMNESVLLYGLADNFPLLMPRWGYAASAFMLFIIGFFGFFLNLMVILLMIKDRQLWTPLNIILFNLVCSDFSVSVLGNPLTLISALFYRWVFGKTMCVIYGFFMALLGITSITSLTVLAFERYMLVSRPLSSKQLTSRGAVICIAFIWCYSLVLTTPPLFGWGNYVHEAANISCSVNWHEQSTNSLTYILYLFVFGLIVPLIVISYSYYNIIRTMKKNAQRLGRVSKAEAKVTNMVFVMIIAFIVAWTPYSIFALMEQFATDGIISPGVGVIPALVAKSSICYDPLIYVGMNTQFRQSIKRVFGIRSTRSHSQTEKCNENTLITPSVRPSRNDTATLKCNNLLVSQNNKLQNDIIIENESRTYSNNLLDINKHDKEANDIDDNINVTIDLKHFDNKIIKTDSYNKMNNYDEDSNQDNNSTFNIIDDNRLIFSKTPLLLNERDDKKIFKNVYSNKAFENHPENYKHEERENKQKVKQSISLEPITVSNRIMTRKLSIDITLDEQLDTSASNNVVFNKYKDVVVLKPKRNDYRTYLVINGGDTDED